MKLYEQETFFYDYFLTIEAGTMVMEWDDEVYINIILQDNLLIVDTRYRNMKIDYKLRRVLK